MLGFMHDSREQFPLLWDVEWLKARYLEDEMTSTQIAAIVGCTRTRVEQRLKNLGITLRGRHFGRWQSKICEKCGTTYTPSGPTQKFCSQRCARGVGVCPHCGNEFLLHADKTTGYCSRKCYWEHKKANGTQGRYVRQDGYIRLSVPEGTPGRQGDGRMPEHRYVMQVHLGRPIRDEEDVHHINGQKDDNRLVNLELWARSQPRGQRAVDLLDWADEIRARYAAERAAGLI